MTKITHFLIIAKATTKHHENANMPKITELHYYNFSFDIHVHVYKFLNLLEILKDIASHKIPCTHTIKR